MATGRMWIGHRLPTSVPEIPVANHRYQRRWHRARVEHRSRRGDDTELGIQRPARVANHRERQLADVVTQFLIGRVEHHDLTDTSGDDLVVSTHDRLQMNVADGAAGEPP